MQCGMCESHINDAIRAAFPVKRVTSSSRRGETVILSETDIEEQKLIDTVEKTGYEVHGVAKKVYEKRGLFSRLGK